MMDQRDAPFKFLDAYQEEDRDVFFGRENEIEELYDALNGVKHLLVYGPSGAGKTSLVECGLRNQFSDADWHAVTIRRRNNINASVYEAINEALEEKLEIKGDTGLPYDKELGFGETIEKLFDERYQPIYLLFDQFEELLLLGNQEEKIDFFTRLNALIRYRVPCRVILIMREEFIGHLSEFEHLCPSIFQHRFRLEKMGRSNVRQVIYQILEAPHYEPYFKVEDSDELADQILSKLPDQKKEIELTHVQVFLSELWDRAKTNDSDGQLPVLSQNLIEKEDNLESVLDAFLKKQLKQLEADFGEKIPLELLAVMISERSTKLQMTANDIQDELLDKEIDLGNQLPSLLEELELRRIIRTLKTGEETRYEISHDLLAYVIGQNLTEEMQLREKAAGIYRLYAERQGFFSIEDLDYLRPFQQYKAYPKHLAQRIQESEAFIKEEQERELNEAKAQAEKEQALRGEAEVSAQRATQRTWIASMVAVLALVAAGAAFHFYQDAEEQTQVANNKTLEAQQEKERAKIQETIAIAASERSDSLRLVAVEQLEEIQRKEAIIVQEQENTQKALTEVEQKEKERQEAENKRIKTEVDRKIELARSYMNNDGYQLALTELLKAIKLDPMNNEIKKLIRDCESKLN